MKHKNDILQFRPVHNLVYIITSYRIKKNKEIYILTQKITNKTQSFSKLFKLK